MSGETQRSYRVADLLITAHSILRDRYNTYATTLDLLILGASVCLGALAFADTTPLEQALAPTLSVTNAIGIAAALTFFLSLIQLRVDWKQRSSMHAQAAKAFSEAKFALGEALADAANSALNTSALNLYRSAGHHNVSIPDRKFNNLKKKHLVKIRISKVLSEHPGTSIILIRTQIFFSDTLRLLGMSKELE